MWPWPKQNSLWCGWAWPWPELLSCCGWAWPWPELNCNDVMDENDLDLNWTLVKVTFTTLYQGFSLLFFVFFFVFVKLWWVVFTTKMLMWLQSVWGAEVRACAEESQSSGYPRFRLRRLLNKAGCKGLSLNNTVWKSDYVTKYVFMYQINIYLVSQASKCIFQ